MPGPIKVKGTLLVSAICDAATMTGLLLTGMGERNLKNQTNFLVVDKEVTDQMIEEKLRQLLDRDDVGIVLISQNIAERVRNIIIEHDAIIPTILEIPSKETPYEPEKDTVVIRAASILWGQDTGMDKLKQMTAAQKM